jgi:hypothetical protein
MPLLGFSHFERRAECIATDGSYIYLRGSLPRLHRYRRSGRSAHPDDYDAQPRPLRIGDELAEIRRRGVSTTLISRRGLGAALKPLGWHRDGPLKGQAARHCASKAA